MHERTTLKTVSIYLSILFSLLVFGSEILFDVSLQKLRCKGIAHTTFPPLFGVKPIPTSRWPPRPSTWPLLASPTPNVRSFSPPRHFTQPTSPPSWKSWPRPAMAQVPRPTTCPSRGHTTKTFG